MFGEMGGEPGVVDEGERQFGRKHLVEDDLDGKFPVFLAKPTQLRQSCFQFLRIVAINNLLNGGMYWSRSEGVCQTRVKGLKSIIVEDWNY
jgi:hypothetical protein